MRLGQLIDTLAALDDEMPVQFSDGTTPGKFGSWRGRYAELTIFPAEEGFGSLATVGQLRRAAEKAVGKTFSGYKGGEFVMGRNTPVWADGWGDCDYRAISGVTVDDGAVTLAVTVIEEYV